MKGIESVINGRKTLAVVFRNNLKVKELQFFTHDDNDLQVGIHARKKGIKLIPHIHEIKKPLRVKSIQEVLYIEKGKVRVTIYTDSGSVISKKILLKGDSILLISGGHAVDFLENSRIFEVKQGPYSSTVHSKIYIN